MHELHFTFRWQVVQQPVRDAVDEWREFANALHGEQRFEEIADACMRGWVGC